MARKDRAQEQILGNTSKRLVFTVLALVLLYVVTYVIDPYAASWKNYFDRPFSDMLTEWGISIGFCALISESSIAISNWLNRSMHWTSQPGRRLAVEAALNLIVVLIINMAIDLMFLLASDSTECTVFGGDLSIEKARGIAQWVAASAMISIMIMGINIGNYLIINWRNESLRVSELNQAAAESELLALKLQIDPHFVFNNLSVLTELILEDQQLGYDYAENFSRIYRYMLVNAKKDVIPLEEELKFLKSYMFLIEHRFGEGVQFEIQVDNTVRHLSLPPLTLQLLVENALKHNRTSKKDPLRVRIYVNEAQKLVVENALLPIETPMESSGIGLSNIVKRYRLLSDKEPEISEDATTFKVILPLIA